MSGEAFDTRSMPVPVNGFGLRFGETRRTVDVEMKVLAGACRATGAAGGAHVHLHPEVAAELADGEFFAAARNPSGTPADQRLSVLEVVSRGEVYIYEPEGGNVPRSEGREKDAEYIPVLTRLAALNYPTQVEKDGDGLRVKTHVLERITKPLKVSA